MRNRKAVFVTLIVILYLATWVGGWIQHSQDLEADAWTHYRAAEQHNAERIQYAKLHGREPFLLQLREGGPATQVNWCVPILPCVLLADSDSVLGPLSGYGGPKIVLYYGLGSTELLWFGWIS